VTNQHASAAHFSPVFWGSGLCLLEPTSRSVSRMSEVSSRCPFRVVNFTLGVYVSFRNASAVAPTVEGEKASDPDTEVPYIPSQFVVVGVTFTLLNRQ
jgi:hypothetical protein